MEETLKTIRRRAKHIKIATQVNKQHADNLKRATFERHKRSKQQIKTEVVDNRVIDYRRHMKWLRR
ncbi:hypothetical protein [Leuconostoc miyukkimchii]|uniref:hypothetical protein n=1 Tax=Leuconostoc miyukkimchii TaxID=910540 RepID=UPI001C7D5FA5|nr:hypothetical protein [Leuconostoc miyukkimchii]